MRDRDADDRDQRTQFSRRALLIGLGQAGAFGILSTRLYQLQVVDESRYALLAEENRINLQVLAAERGRLLDRYGEVLADNKEGYRAEIVPSLAGDVRGVLQRLSRIVAIGAEDQERYVQRARRQPVNIPIIVASDLTWEQLAQINLLAPQLPGVRTESAGRRRYFHGRTVGHIVGYVGSVDRAALDDDPVLRLPGIRIGKTGVERGMDEALRGGGGTVKQEVDVRGRIIRILERSEPLPGRDVAITIDTKLQERVLQRLSRERRAASVIMHVDSGEVVAMGSVPTFDPNDIVTGLNDRGWNRLQSARDDPMTNRALRGLYPPGSTFKMVTALAALEAGIIDLKEKITCEGRLEYAGQNFRCWNRSGHGNCDMHRALRESCDVYFYEIARRTGIGAIAAMARRLGHGQVFDCGMSQQKRGIVPDADWKRGRFNRPWLGGETLLAGIGQGYVLSTPLQLAVMMARLATGRAITPAFVRPEPGDPKRDMPLLGVRPEWLAAMRRGLHAVVNESGGTGSKARAEDEGFTVAGKTGTSQVSRFSSDTAQNDLRWELRDHALFVAYAPSERPRYAIATIVEHGGGGGSTAAPLTKDLLVEVMSRDPMSKPAYPEIVGGTPGAAPPGKRQEG
jgi:penicillin-binding protein 2